MPYGTPAPYISPRQANNIAKKYAPAIPNTAENGDVLQVTVTGTGANTTRTPEWKASAVPANIVTTSSMEPNQINKIEYYETVTALPSPGTAGVLYVVPTE